MARPQRIPNYGYFGVQRYFLTMCTNHRAEHFKDPEAVHIVITALTQTAVDHAFTIVIYCVMPDHLHLLVDGEHDGADFQAFVKMSKQRAGWRFKQRYGTSLWQNGYYERVLRNEESTESVVSYIVANPVRKGLVEDPRDYPYWGSMRLSREELLASIAVRRVQ
jgi:REP element-mobilizing transposase RayT